MQKAKIDNLELWGKLKNAKTTIESQIARNELFGINYYLIEILSKALCVKIGNKVSVEDLASAGVEGLFDAINAFDPDVGVKFSNYAPRRIRGEMIDELRRRDIIPRSVRQSHNKIEETRIRLEAESGQSVSVYEVIEELGISLDKYNQKVNRYIPADYQSIDGGGGGDGQGEDFNQDCLDVIIDCTQDNPDRQMVIREFMSKLLSSNFTEIERKIIELHFYKGETYRDISIKLKIPKNKINKYVKDVISKIKDKVRRNPTYFEDIHEFLGGKAKI